ncbi:MAG: RagB/SusD family nutrient uptake outer membrane protein [Prevotella sp.]|jgi:hypothetical protein
MKIYKYIIGAFVACLTFASCDDELDTKNYTDMTSSNFFKSDGDFDAAVTGLYIPLTTNWGYTDGGTGNWYNSLFNADINSYFAGGMVTTDIMRTYSSNIYDEFNVGPSSSGAINSTYNMMRFVARATDVINRISQSSASTEASRNRYIAEAKTLRAFYMYVLLDFFGPCNVKLDPSTLMSNEIEPRPDNATYVNYIESDLNDAIATSSFPDKYNDDPTQWGRMSKAIAYSIKMRLAMHEKQWEEAKEACNHLMSMGYSLLSNYEDVFKSAVNDEIVWGVPANTASDNYYVTEVLPGDFKRGYNCDGRSYIRGTEDSYFGGWQVYCMRWDFYDTFQANDKRKRVILCEYDAQDGSRKTRETGMAGALPIKFMDTEFANYGTQTAQPIVRYAEVLLSFAEAENELNGPTSTAINALKQVTDRAGIEIPASATQSKDAFRSYLLEERGHELFAEGVRRQDLIRHGEYIKRAQARGNNAKDYQVLFPIPQFAITEAGGILKQNDGYTE